MDRKKLSKAVTYTLFLVVMILIAHLASSCAATATDAKTQFVAAQKIYCTTVDSLTMLKTQGQFSQKDTANITIAVNEGAAFLTRWKTAIEAGQPTLDYYAEFQAILDKLLLYQIQKE